MLSLKNANRFARVINKALFRVDSSLSYARTVDAIRALCARLESDEEMTDSVWCAGSIEGASVADIIAGAYWFFSHNHSGQWSDEYRALCALGNIYSPGPCSQGPEDSAEDVYNALAELQERN